MERVSGFIRSFLTDDEEPLRGLYQEALAEGIPVIRKETKEFIKTLIMIKKPMRILELGAAIGYSSLYMSEAMQAGGKIVTVELDDERYVRAVSNIKKMNRETMISVIHGDALQVISELEADSFDMIFVDAAKGQYIHYLPQVMRVVRDDGIIVSDNVLQDGEIFESHFVVEKRNRTIHERMREYLYAITHDDRMVTSINPVGDGVAVTCVKKTMEQKGKLFHDGSKGQGI
ncbi:MAG: O-methyltransferase [Clostridium sp.]|nr:O-methyltransferase [Clostridium sp.]MCM1398188.1 O-methyltransferase [Clostridium sp.]